MAKLPFSFADAQQAAASRKAKSWLLPMSPQDADRILLRYHVALATMRAGRGERIHLQLLLQMTVLASFIGDAYAASLCPDVMAKVEHSILQAVARGDETNAWALDQETIGVAPVTQDTRTPLG
ncbi:hypothetical protein WT83_32050 [Burkholderia territorii]|uniref:Fis family transcriptional regulator n=1 Tax=Burkholderia territorii TaxID=1503055 RepID=A0A119VC69_9BURK|nr:hypothetical protein [Burkholderia territorii]KWN03692.1 hypothetical protein WT83_32050 [Burkholderia territorii]